MHAAFILIAPLLMLLAACDRNEPRNRGTGAPHDAAGKGGQETTASRNNEASDNPDTAFLTMLRHHMEAVRSLHRPLGPPHTGDWLATNREHGQTFNEYMECSPILPSPVRRAIHVLPIGRFTATQLRVIASAAEYIQCCFGLPVVVDTALQPGRIPRGARRHHPRWGTPQIRTSFIIDTLLRPRLPGDAAALIAFTSMDLWPGDDMNFVFGQGSTRNRVGVWSLFRFGGPNASGDAFTLLLLRTLKCATHELGHMFSMQHCTRHECAMNGCNSLDEMDRHQLAFCPECAAKICWATRYTPRARCAALAGFCARNGLAREAEFERMEMSR